MKSVQLNTEETARYTAFADACRERTKGFSLGMEAARQIFLEQLVAEHKPDKEDADGDLQK